MRGIITKPRLSVWLLVAATIPWRLGGKEPLGILVDVLLVALATFLLLRSADIRQVSIFGLLWLPIGLLAWGIFSITWSVNRYQTIMWSEKIGLSVMVFLLAVSLGHSKKLREEWLTGYIGVATMASAWGIGLYLLQSYDRVTSSFYLANPFAAYVLPALILAGCKFVKTGHRIMFISTIILGTAFILADSRSAFIMMAAAVLASFFARPNIREVMRGVGIAVMVLALVGAANFVRVRLQHNEVTVQGSRFIEAVKGESTSLIDRMNYLKSTAAIWQRFPLLGAGAGTFGTMHPVYQYRVISASSHAHNWYAQTLSELGLVGGLLSLGIVAAVGMAVVWSFKSQNSRVVAVVLVLMIIHLALDIDSNYPSILVILGFFTGGLVAGMPWVERYSNKISTSMVALLLAGLALVPAWGAYVSKQKADLALVAQKDGDYPTAVALYAQAHAGWVFNPDVISAEGIAHYALAGAAPNQEIVNRELDKAKKLALQAQSLDAYDAQHMLLRARVMLKEHHLDGAEMIYRRILELDQYNHPEYYSDLVYLYMQKNQPKQAFATTNKALSLYTPGVVVNRSVDKNVPIEVAKLYLYRAVLEQKVDPKRARKDVLQSLNLQPNNQEARLMLEQLSRS